MNIKTIHGQLLKNSFVRVESVDNNTVYIGKHEIPIGNIYRDYFLSEFITKKILRR